MGNAIMTPCFVQQKPSSSSSLSSSIKLVFCGGPMRFLRGKQVTGQVMFKFSKMMVCHADSFFMGFPVLALALDDELMSEKTYFILAIDHFACKVLSPSWLAALGSSSSSLTIEFGESPSPFEYLNGSN